MPCTCQCKCAERDAKRAAALAIKDLSPKEKAKVYRTRYDEKHPGKHNEAKRRWAVLNRAKIAARKKTKYAEQKKTGQTYYQKNKQKKSKKSE